VEARHTLEQHTWPGNVAELALLVRHLADSRRLSGPVRSEELPDAVRGAAGARHLSSLERAERAAILDALRTYGGNKARAAKALGIARATVYRKLRSYGI
jgi:transcriptional regulator of acetoin/glycerol metabolism